MRDLDEHDQSSPSHTGLWVALGVGGVILLVCAGLIAAGVAGVFYMVRSVREMAEQAQAQMMEQQQQARKQFDQAREMMVAEAAARQFLTLVKQHNDDLAYKNHTSPSFQDNRTLAQFQAQIDKQALMRNFTSASITMQASEPGKANANVKLTGPERELSLTLRMAQVDGNWKVDGLTVP
jgi:hypothetical protein